MSCHKTRKTGKVPLWVIVVYLLILALITQLQYLRAMKPIFTHTHAVIETLGVSATADGFPPSPQTLVADKHGGQRSGFLTLIRASVESHGADWDLSKLGGQGMWRNTDQIRRSPPSYSTRSPMPLLIYNSAWMRCLALQQFFPPIEFLLNYMFGTNIPFCVEVIQLFTVNTTVQ